MSAEQTTLERSALERKDREELTTIAQALGAKPPSRARKADIVQLILELTGVEPSRGGDTAGGGASDRQEATVDEAETPAPAGEPEVAAERPDQDPAPAPSAGAPGGEPPSEWEMEFGGTTDVVDSAAPAADKGKANGNGNRNGESGHGEARQADDRQADDRQADDRQADDRQADDRQADDRQADDRQGEGGPQGGGKPGEGADANDQGNRRRRRRGRRGKDDAPQAEEFSGEPVEVEGLLDLRDEGYGFLRVKGYLPSKDDIYVSVKQVRQFGLRKGDHVRGASRPAMRNEKNPALLRIDTVNGLDPEQARRRRRFEDLTPLFPDEKLSLETVDDPTNMTARIVDLIAPIGKGQRGLIVSPPKAGKTAIVKQVARSIETNNPEVKLMVLLVDERPEEVTDMRRWLRGETSEVVASTFDRPSEEHTQVAELTIERAKRLVEDGRDVCIILDGITRLARAYNLAAPATGRIMSGGVDSGALYPPKKFFGAARNIEEGGSLTILATALIETGSKMDEVIFEEFKGTGNMELRLDRRLAERRVYPAIDVDASSTRHEELLFPRQQLQLVWALRRVLSGLSSTDGGNAAALELLIDRMKTFRANDEFLAEVAKNRLAAG
jgi:transcription termination factor Rho